MKTTTKRVFQVLLFCLLAAALALGTAMVTSAAEVQGETLAAGYHVGAEDSQYVLEASGTGWKIKNSDDQYLKADYNQYQQAASSISFGATGTILTIDNYTQDQGWSIHFPYPSGTTSQVYLNYSGSAFSFGDSSSKIKIYSSGGGSTEPTTEPTTDVPEETQPATTESKIEYSKKIEHIGNEDEYNYRLHLTIDGENLASTTTVPGEPVKERKIGILLDVTETMLSTWSGSENGADNKFGGVRKLLQGNDGFLNSILDGHTEVYIIVVGGRSGSSTYLELSDKIASGKTLGDFSNINNSLHVAQGISYVTGLKAAEYYLGNDIDSLVYIVGNETDTYVDYATGNLERGTTGTSAMTKNYSDYVTFMGNHPELSMYMLYVTPTNRGSDIAQQMGAYSVSRGTGGGYYEANNAATLKDKLTQISEEIKIPGDVTKSLTVVDTLSDKVEFTGSSRTAISLTATMWLGNKEGAGTDVSNKVIPDFENKTVTFSGYDTIDGKFYLEIAFNIKTADDVFHESTYPNIGDEDTDYGTNNTTSSNQPGYFSNVKKSSTISYTLNNEPTRTAEFKQPVVQAPEPQDGVYKFTYPDRHETIYYGKDNSGDNGYFAYQMYTKTVIRRLKSAEIRGYSGNDNQAGVPTYLWTDEAKALFNYVNPLVTASFEVQGNLDDEYKNVSFYKHDMNWPTMEITVLPADESIKVDNKDVVVTAEAPEKTFTFKYVTEQNGTVKMGATRIKYAENVTFNPAYKGQEGIHVIEGVTLPENLTYWSSDAAGEHILTTVKTFGMLIRGGYTAEDLTNNVVTVYAQTKAPEGEAFQPFIEEATLTRVIADNEVNRYYADYMVDYLNINGDVVQYMINEGQDVQYGLIVMLADKDETIDQEKMISSLNKLKTNEKQSAYIDDASHFAAYFEYNDAAHISDYNRTLFTIDGKYENLKGKRITAMAYIIVQDADSENKKYYYTPVNTDIFVKKDD